MKRVLVDLGSAADLLKFLALIRLCHKLDNLHNLGRVLVGFNGTLTHTLGEIVLPISTGLITALFPIDPKKQYFLFYFLFYYIIL